jgi:hypothetical protein
MVFPRSNHRPKEIVAGVKKFCSQTGKSFKIVETATEDMLIKETLFFAVITTDLEKMELRCKHDFKGNLFHIRNPFRIIKRGSV